MWSANCSSNFDHTRRLNIHDESANTSAGLLMLIRIFERLLPRVSYPLSIGLQPVMKPVGHIFYTDWLKSKVTC
jgi:hypothetical protein